MPDWEYNNPLFPGDELPPTDPDIGQSDPGSFFDDPSPPTEEQIGYLGNLGGNPRGFHSGDLNTIENDSMMSNNSILPLAALLLYMYL